MIGSLQPRDKGRITIRMPPWPLTNNRVTIAKKPPPLLLVSTAMNIKMRQETHGFFHKPLLPTQPFLQTEQFHFYLYHILQFRMKFHFKKVLIKKTPILDGL